MNSFIYCEDIQNINYRIQLFFSKKSTFFLSTANFLISAYSCFFKSQYVGTNCDIFSVKTNIFLIFCLKFSETSFVNSIEIVTYARGGSLLYYRKKVRFIINNRLITRYSAMHNVKIRVIDLANSEGIEKRRLYDLFNFLTSVGVCRRDSDHCFLWAGLENVSKTLHAIAMENEEKTLKELTDEIFDCGHSPSIGLLATKILGIFIYYGENSISLKTIAAMVAPYEDKVRPMLRRLYLVAFFLEQIELITHGQKNGVYCFKYDSVKILKEAYSEMASKNIFPEETLPSLFHHIPNSYINEIYKFRKELLCRRIKDSETLYKKYKKKNSDKDIRRKYNKYDFDQYSD